MTLTLYFEGGNRNRGAGCGPPRTVFLHEHPKESYFTSDRQLTTLVEEPVVGSKSGGGMIKIGLPWAFTRTLKDV